MESLPFLAWVGIAIIVVITIAVNVGMIALLRGRNQKSMQMPRTARAIDDMRKLQRILRDPLGEERKQLSKLSHLVEDLKEPPDTKPGEEQSPKPSKMD